MVRGLSTLRERFDAVLLDLDGTLLDRHAALTPRAARAVGALVAAGFEVLLCTGRSVSGAAAIHQALGLETPLVAFNGAWIGRPEDAEGAAPWHCQRIRDDLVGELERAEACAGFSFRHREDRKYAVRTTHAHYERVADWYRDVVTVEHAGELPQSGLMRVTCYFDGEGPQEQAWQAIGEEARRDLHREVFPLRIFPAFEDTDLVLCEVQARGRGKAEALAWLCEERGVPARRVVAVGDHSNDLPMLREAGLAVAVGNAVPAVRESAHLVIGAHHEEGIARWVEAGAPLAWGADGAAPAAGAPEGRVASA